MQVSVVFAITAIAVNRVTGQPEYFLVRTLSAGEHATPQIDESIAGVVYSLVEFINFLESYGKVLALRPGVAPQSLRVSYGSHGYRFVESLQNGKRSDLLRKLPRFAFVNEASSEDVNRLFAIDGMVFEPAVAVPEDALQRYIDFGWVRRVEEDIELTELGRALLAFSR